MLAEIFQDFDFGDDENASNGQFNPNKTRPETYRFPLYALAE